MELDFADVKPSILSWVIVGLLSASFIVFMKWALTKWPVPGLTELFMAV